MPVRIDRTASLAVINPVERPGAGLVFVVAAGTSDIPVAEEAALTAECSGSTVERVYDVGVAGIHRLLAAVDRLSKANVIVAVAGMEGALPTVVAGLVACPVLAVPTSVGYGASFGGLAALLTMLNSCAPGHLGREHRQRIRRGLLGERHQPDGGTRGRAGRQPGRSDLQKSYTTCRFRGSAVRCVYIDAFSGVSGDMLLGALVDLGVPVELLQEALDRLSVDHLELASRQVIRSGITCTKVDVEYDDGHHHRGLHDIAEIIASSSLADTVKEKSLGVFTRLAEAEAAVHGVEADHVHFHEVGAMDAIADIVGVTAGLASSRPRLCTSRLDQRGRWRGRVRTRPPAGPRAGYAAPPLRVEVLLGWPGHGADDADRSGVGVELRRAGPTSSPAVGEQRRLRCGRARLQEVVECCSSNHR